MGFLILIWPLAFQAQAWPLVDQGTTAEVDPGMEIRPEGIVGEAGQTLRSAFGLWPGSYLQFWIKAW